MKIIVYHRPTYTGPVASGYGRLQNRVHRFNSGPPPFLIVLVDPDGVRLTPGNGDVVSRFSANILMLCRACLGLTFIAQKTGMDTIGPMSFTFARYVMGASALLPLAWFESRRRRHCVRKTGLSAWARLGLAV